ncbi:MAG: ABC transporter permease subunit [Bacilli bacterium]|nr:ABC transporter permease subunit [Bacilli bacterium]
MEQLAIRNVREKVKAKAKEEKFSWPLFRQSIKSNRVLWLVMALGSAAIFIIVNLVVGTKAIFTNIDMQAVQQYVKDEGMSWLQVLGLLEKMGFSLARIQIMTQIDLNSILNELIYKIAGVLLPMIYVMIVSNRLLASQVSDGSMAYVLSTPTNRKKVVRTQYLFLFLSLVAMYLVISICAIGSGAIALAIVNQTIPFAQQTSFATYFLRSFLYCFSSFLAMFGLSGVCFGASALFNKSSQSIAVGGGSCVFAFLFCILGLFSHKVLVSAGVGVEAMKIFNYLSIYTLIDTESISNFAKAATGVDAPISFNWIWELCILFVIGVSLAYVGARRFEKKDLPL